MTDPTKPARRWKHKKRGSTYVEIGRGKMQSENWIIDEYGTGESVDMADVVIYRSESDGSLWVRPVVEFEDGRFEKLESKS